MNNNPSLKWLIAFIMVLTIVAALAGLLPGEVLEHQGMTKWIQRSPSLRDV